MSPTTTKPTILIIHGSWHSPIHFLPLQTHLHQHNFPTICPLLPTYNPSPSPPGPVISLSSDVKVIQSILRTLVMEERKRVIVVMHSYGGVVGTEAVKEEYSEKWRGNRGLEGGVMSLFWISAFILGKGESIFSTLGGESPIIKNHPTALTTILTPTQTLYHDLPPSTQTYYTTHLAPTPANTTTTPVTYTAYIHYKNIYLICENDRAIPVGVQEGMIEKVRAREGMGEWEVLRCGSGHCPFLSRVEFVGGVVRGMVGEGEGGREKGKL